MKIKIKKPCPSDLKSQDFGNFTRDSVAAILKKAIDAKSEVFVPMAAALLAGIDAQGSSPGNDLIATALDVLAHTDTSFAHDLLWQAAEHARNARIRTEAIRRSGLIATPERAILLRKWAAEGFPDITNYQHDNVDRNSIREAAIHALGSLVKPTADDIDAILAGLTPPANQGEFSQPIFYAACEAYWCVGDEASLPKLNALVSQRWRGEIRIVLLALAAKFSGEQLKPHAESLQGIFLEAADSWPTSEAWQQRLLQLAESLRTPQFLLNWAARWGGDGVEHHRGRVSSRLLEGFEKPTEDLAKAFLTLAQWENNLAANGPIIQGLKKCVEAGHGKLVAERIVVQNSDGHRRLLESGAAFAIYDSMETAMTNICEALSACQNSHQFQCQAVMVATGAMAGACSNEMPEFSPRLVPGRNQGQKSKLDEESLKRIVSIIERLDPSLNPVVVAARLVPPPVSLPAAKAICECWLGQGDALARYVLRMVVREAGRADTFGQEAPMLLQFERSLLASPPQQPSRRPLLEEALLAEVIVDGKVNRHAIDLMQQEGLAFEKGCENALNELQTKEDAQFLLERLRDKNVINVLAKSIRFHRDGKEPLTKYVQATSIAFATELLKRSADKKLQKHFIAHLHERFQDLPAVREAAYRACGELGDFLSIEPLRARLPRETATAAKKVIEQALDVFRKRLIEEKPHQGDPATIKEWLSYVADLGDPAILQLVVGYLSPPHADHAVRHAALLAIEQMPSPESLEAVKKFIDDTAPEGETLVIARHVRLSLEDRNDAELFDVLGSIFPQEASVLNPTTNYEQLLSAVLLRSITKSLQKTQTYWQNGLWDDIITALSGIMEGLVRRIFHTQHNKMNLQWDKKKLDTMARQSLNNLLNLTEFKNTFGKLQSHCNTIYAYRGEAATAHVTNTDGSAKTEAIKEDAEYIQEEFRLAFTEAINALC